MNLRTITLLSIIPLFVNACGVAPSPQVVTVVVTATPLVSGIQPTPEQWRILLAQDMVDDYKFQTEQYASDTLSDIYVEVGTDEFTHEEYIEFNIVTSIHQRKGEVKLFPQLVDYVRQLLIYDVLYRATKSIHWPQNYSPDAVTVVWHSDPPASEFDFAKITHTCWFYWTDYIALAQPIDGNFSYSDAGTDAAEILGVEKSRCIINNLYEK